MELANRLSALEEQIEDAEIGLTEQQRQWAATRLANELPRPPRTHNRDGKRLPIISSLLDWLRARQEQRFLKRLEPLGIPWTKRDAQGRT